MKTKLIAFMSLVVAMTTACKPTPKDEPTPEPTPVKLELIGSWRSTMLNGAPLTTNERTILSYISSNKFTMSLARYIPEYQIFTWRNKAMGSYTFDGTNLVHDAADPSTSYKCTAAAIDAQSMRVNYHTFVNERGEEIAMQDTIIFERIEENLGYDERILGLWEGTANSGEETYGDYHHRWEYKPIDRSGFYTYTYYNYDPLQSQWVATKQNTSDYNVDGSWLATRWTAEGSSEMDYEWWDIDFITDSTMQWSALRSKSDGTGTFRATFNFRRVFPQ